MEDASGGMNVYSDTWETSLLRRHEARKGCVHSQSR